MRRVAETDGGSRGERKGRQRRGRDRRWRLREERERQSRGGRWDKVR